MVRKSTGHITHDLDCPKRSENLPESVCSKKCGADASKQVDKAYTEKRQREEQKQRVQHLREMLDEKLALADFHGEF